MTSKRRKWVLIVACAVLVFTLTLLLTRPREPYYNGRSYTHWLATYDLDCRQSESPDDPQTVAYWALRQIGTNAIPILLKWTAHEPQSLHGRLRPLEERLPDFVIRRPFIARLLQDPYSGARLHNTWLAFFVLGSNANCAIPDLTRLMNDPSAEYNGCSAAISLAQIGPAALPPLMSAAANPQARCRVPAISALSNMGSNALPAVPLLVQCLTNTNQIVTDVAAYSLCRLRLSPDTVFPVLTNRLNYLDPETGVSAAEWLGEFETFRPLSRSLLLVALSGPDDYVRTRATNALLKIAPEVLTNAPPR